MLIPKIDIVCLEPLETILEAAAHELWVASDTSLGGIGFAEETEFGGEEDGRTFACTGEPLADQDFAVTLMK